VATAPKRRDQIDLPSDKRLGRFVNAFRVSEGPGAECFLDFMLYSAVEDHAEVVARVRVPREFLPIVHGRLDEVVFDTLMSVETVCLH
jgi:hypothetical protein